MERVILLCIGARNACETHRKRTPQTGFGSKVTFTHFTSGEEIHSIRCSPAAFPPVNNFYGRPFIRAGTTMKLLFSFTAFWKGMRQ